jgi:hypothetical protein
MRWKLLAIVAFSMVSACTCLPNTRFGTGGGTRAYNATAAEQEAIGLAHSYGFGNSRDEMVRIVAIGIAESSLNSAARHWHNLTRLDANPCCDNDRANPQPWFWGCYPRCVADRGWLQINANTWGPHTRNPSSAACGAADEQADTPSVATVFARCMFNYTAAHGSNGWDTWDAWRLGKFTDATPCQRAKCYYELYTGTRDGWPSVPIQVDAWCRSHGNPRGC